MNLLITAVGNGGDWTTEVVLEHLLKPDDTEANCVFLCFLKLSAIVERPLKLGSTTHHL